MDRGVPPARADVEVALHEGLVVVARERGNVRVRSPTHRVGGLDGPFEDALQAQDLQHGSENSEIRLSSLSTRSISLARVEESSDGELLDALYLGGQKRDGHAEERHEAGPQGHRGRDEIPESSRHDDGNRVPGHQRGRRRRDLRARVDPGYPQRREEDRAGRRGTPLPPCRRPAPRRARSRETRARAARATRSRASPGSRTTPRRKASPTAR